MFYDYFNGQLELFHLNFGMITLLPKKEEAVRIEQFRTICLMNLSFKIFMKVGTNRLTRITHSMVQPSETTFMPGRHILEGVVVLHETPHEIHSKKLDGSSRWILKRHMIKLNGLSFNRQCTRRVLMRQGGIRWIL